MDTYKVYEDLAARTGNFFHLGIVGPQRSGKSTFVRRFAELMVLPELEEYDKKQALDEMPISGSGRAITTMEPKFIPKEPVEISLFGDTKVNVRLIDCVGYMVDGAISQLEDGSERMVKTPWLEEEIPFSQAAEMGTQKVIVEHASIGIVITTDGSFGEIPRSGYENAEARTIKELKALGKPFVVILNSSKPHSNETQELAEKISEDNQVSVLPLNCQQLRKEDVIKMMEVILSSFPISKIQFYLPKWVEMLSITHELKQDLLKNLKNILKNLTLIKDAVAGNLSFESSYMKKIKLDQIDMRTGNVDITVEFQPNFYYEILSEITGVPIQGEYQLIATLKDLSSRKTEYEKVGDACNQVRMNGYGVVTPDMDDVSIDEPELMKHGSKFGVKIKATAPSIHMIKADIETEIAPIVGSQAQAEDLINYIQENAKNGKEGIWNTNIFGKSIQQLVEDGIRNKANNMTDESQEKLQETIHKVMNDNNGGLVCIII